MSGVSALTTLARFSSIPNGTGLPPPALRWPRTCQAGLTSRAASSCPGTLAAVAMNAAPARGLTAQNSRLARCG